MTRNLRASRNWWLALAGAMLGAAPVLAIIYGQPDTDNRFPNAGLVITPAPGGGFFVLRHLQAGRSLLPARDFVEREGVLHSEWTGALTWPNTERRRACGAQEFRAGTSFQLSWLL